MKKKELQSGLLQKLTGAFDGISFKRLVSSPTAILSVQSFLRSGRAQTSTSVPSRQTQNGYLASTLKYYMITPLINAVASVFPLWSKTAITNQKSSAKPQASKKKAGLETISKRKTASSTGKSKKNANG